MAPTPVKSNRDVVKHLWSQGHTSAREISGRSGVPLRSCERYVSQLRKTGEIPEIRRSGRPRKVSPVMRRHLGRLVTENHFITASEIKTQLEVTYPDFEIGEQTIRDELARLGYTASLPRRVPLLTEQAKENRLQWAQRHVHYDWSRVVFSDETTLQMFRNTCLAWSLAGKPVAPMVKHPYKVHMWAAVCARGKVGMHMFEENMDRHLYRRILNKNLYGNATHLYGRLAWIFQQDNDPKHTSKDVRTDLDARLPDRVLPWPSYSPDMNPMENIWAVLKHNVEKKVKLKLAQKKNVSPAVFCRLVRQEWKAISDTIVFTCIGNMSERVQALIAAKGEHTRY